MLTPVEAQKVHTNLSETLPQKETKPLEAPHPSNEVDGKKEEKEATPIRRIVPSTDPALVTKEGKNNDNVGGDGGNVDGNIGGEVEGDARGQVHGVVSGGVIQTGSNLSPPAVGKQPSQHAVECLRRLKGHRAPRGKRKVEFITDPAKRASTFSTLRQTIMRKLGELEVKCDAKILIAFHSHKKHVKTYAYGLNNWSSNKSNFDKVCQQTFYDRPCAPEGQDPLAEKARDELRSIYRSLMQRFCQGKNPGYGKPGKCPKWMPPELWIMVDKMKPDQLREAIRKVEDVIKQEHNSKVPRMAPPPPPLGGVRGGAMFSGMGLQGSQGLMNSRDMMPHPNMVPSQLGHVGMHGIRNPHITGMKDQFMPPSVPQFMSNAGMMHQMKQQHQPGNPGFNMRPPIVPPHMQGGQLNPHHQNQMQGGVPQGQMTPTIPSFAGGKKPQGGQQPRIDLDDTEDIKDNFNQQGMMQKQMPMPSPSLALLSPNFKIPQSPATPGFQKKPTEWEDQSTSMKHQELQSHYSAFAQPHQAQMPHISQPFGGMGGMQQQQMMDRIPQHMAPMQPRGNGGSAHGHPGAMYSRMGDEGGMNPNPGGQQHILHARGEFKMPQMPMMSHGQTNPQATTMQQGPRGMAHQMGSQMGAMMHQSHQMQHNPDLAQNQHHQQPQHPDMQQETQHLPSNFQPELHSMQQHHDGPPQKKQKM